MSIGLPVHNGERFLAEALESLLSQSFSDFELIISDNASTDATESICREYAAKDPRIRYVRNRKNLGAAENYNLVVQASSGRYFKWAAHDDLCHADFLARCVEILDKDDTVVVCYSRTMIIDENGGELWEYADEIDLTGPTARGRFRKWLLEAPGECNAVFGLIRTAALKKTGLIGKFKASDMILLGELALRGKLMRLPDILFYRRDHPGTSVRAHHGDGAREAWFDPAHRRRIPMPWTRWFREYMKAVARAPIDASDKMYCRGSVLRWTARSRNKFKNEIISATRRAMSRRAAII